jgi:glycerol-3-phosphate dehydrogenase
MTAATNRSDSWSRLDADTLDVLVIGGGIVGAGVIRDAAMRGLRVGLIDQQDFAEGTSGRSSRLLHGGLRYLEQWRVFLVREASLEKKIVHHIAPHLSRPMGFVFPAYRGQGRPLWQLRIGVKLYDLLCSGRNFHPSRGMSRKETLQTLPALRSEGVTGAAYYFDALTNDARLVIDSLRSAENHGATLLNYARFNDARREGNEWICRTTDQETGQPHVVRAKAIVNATGPWANQLAQSDVKLRLSKGIHIVIDHSRLPVPSAVVITEGSRILFVSPWGDRVIIGTTDTDYDGAPEDVHPTADDVAYVLQTLNEFFPAADVEESDIVATWAGLRPLIADPNGRPSDISRAHQIQCPEPAWWDVAGGKLTTYRLMAEQTIDQIARHLNAKVEPCRTATETLLPDAQPFSGIEPAPWSKQAVEHFVTNEWAAHLDDVLVRRSGWHRHDRLSRQQVEEVAGWMAAFSEWINEQRTAEVDATLKKLELETSEAWRTVAGHT